MVPNIVFIVPYRAREQQLFFFRNYMKYIMEDYNENEYKILFSHQTDKREFNRGATKNIGFLAVKEMYPDDYKDITFVFNDIDTIPHKKGLLKYNTNIGVVKHFYGFIQALGGIFSIKGRDFEKLNGFPNYWGWGFEDNAMNARVLKNSMMSINRDNFFKIGDNNIIQLFDSVTRSIVLKNKQKFANDKPHDGLTAIRDLTYDIVDDMINIKTFTATDEFVASDVVKHDFFNEERKSMFSFRQGLKSNDIATSTPVQPSPAPPVRQPREQSPIPPARIANKPLITNGGHISVTQANKSISMNMNKNQRRGKLGKGFKMF